MDFLHIFIEPTYEMLKKISKLYIIIIIYKIIILL